MSMSALRWARGVRGISATQKFVLVMLADQANDYGEAWPSALLLAQECCLTDRAVRDAMDVLEARGLIAGERSKGRATRWRMNIGATPEPCSVVTRRKPRNVVPVTPEGRSDPPRNVVPPTPERGSDRTLRNPHTTLKEPSTRTRKPDPMQGFAEFWRIYPRKVGKGQAEKAWPKAVAAAGGNHEDILAGLKVAIALESFDLRDDARFCPHASTWLNGKRWLDGIEPEPDAQPSLLPTH